MSLYTIEIEYTIIVFLLYNETLTGMHKSLKIVLVDDNDSFRQAVRQFLEIELNYDIIGDFSNGFDFINSNTAYKADIVLIDIQMPELNGITTAKKWEVKNYQTKFIAVTMFTEKAYLLPLIEAGFKGCIYKSNFYSEIKAAINAVLNDRTFFPKNIQI